MQSKLTHPVWVKPDWAFIEEGLSVPTNPADRVEQGVLGEYALGFGRGISFMARCTRDFWERTSHMAVSGSMTTI